MDAGSAIVQRFPKEFQHRLSLFGQRLHVSRRRDMEDHVARGTRQGRQTSAVFLGGGAGVAQNRGGGSWLEDGHDRNARVRIGTRVNNGARRKRVNSINAKVPETSPGPFSYLPFQVSQSAVRESRALFRVLRISPRVFRFRCRVSSKTGFRSSHRQTFRGGSVDFLGTDFKGIGDGTERPEMSRFTRMLMMRFFQFTRPRGARQQDFSSTCLQYFTIPFPRTRFFS